MGEPVAGGRTFIIDGALLASLLAIRPDRLRGENTVPESHRVRLGLCGHATKSGPLPQAKEAPTSA